VAANYPQWLQESEEFRTHSAVIKTIFLVHTVKSKKTFFKKIKFAMLAITLCTAPLTIILAPSAHAQSSIDALVKQRVAPDLLDAITAKKIDTKSNWIKEDRGVRLVKALVIANSSDVELTSLRAEVLAAGGSIYYRYVSVTGLSVMLPASRIAQIARRSDVVSMSANRMTSKTDSFLQTVTGSGSASRSKGTTLDGRGVGIAVLDSGVMAAHHSFDGGRGNFGSRVAKSVDFTQVGDAEISGARDWKAGIDASVAVMPEALLQMIFENRINGDYSLNPDGFGHGTFVASVAAGGRIPGSSVDSSGVAPGADIISIKILADNGIGQVSDALAGIDWAIANRRKYNIRILNLSLATDSAESYITDPLCRAVRSAVASGIVVVVAAGNFGKTANGQERYGSISSPGSEPTVITVGSANTYSTSSRLDESVNMFSSRGPTRGAYVKTNGVRVADNILKPDLVAPGNKLIGSLSTDFAGSKTNDLVTKNPGLRHGKKGTFAGNDIMTLSGTSVAAPVVAGTIALMLQANPSLTPPMVKAILQYSAQPVANANLLQQGAGLLNTQGAVDLASAMRKDIAQPFEKTRLKIGDSLIPAGVAFPAPETKLNGQTIGWSRIVFAGGSHVLTGEDLFRKLQGFHDQQISWVRTRVTSAQPIYNPYTGTLLGYRETGASPIMLVTKGVKSLTAALGTTSYKSKTGAFTPTTVALIRAVNGAGVVLAEGIVVAEGLVLAEGVVLAEGIVVAEGIVIAEGIILAEGIVMAEGIVISESGQTITSSSSDWSLWGEP
jgi:serine protease AprX